MTVRAAADSIELAPVRLSRAYASVKKAAHRPLRRSLTVIFVESMQLTSPVASGRFACG
jgi:hypothetical protein